MQLTHDAMILSSVHDWYVILAYTCMFSCFSKMKAELSEDTA